MKVYTFKATYTDDVERLEVLERVNRVLTSFIEDSPDDSFTINTGKKDNLFFIEATYTFNR